MITTPCTCFQVILAHMSLLYPQYTTMHDKQYVVSEWTVTSISFELYSEDFYYLFSSPNIFKTYLEPIFFNTLVTQRITEAW